MSRFDDYDYEEQFPNQGELWRANVKRALAGKRGKKALAELREALLALPEKRLIAGALCTVGGVDKRVEPQSDPRGYYRQDLEHKLQQEGEGVCAIGAYLWYRKVKAGADPEAAFDDLPTLLDTDGGSDYETAMAGKAAGLTYALASSLAYRNDSIMDDLSPEARWDAFMRWLYEQLDPVAAGA